MTQETKRLSAWSASARISGVAVMLWAWAGCDEPTSTISAHEERIAPSTSRLELGERTTVPHTGVSLQPPPGLTLAAIGGSFADASFHTTIMVGVHPAGTDVAAMFEHYDRHEPISLRLLPATLHVRRRGPRDDRTHVVALTAVDGERELLVLGETRLPAAADVLDALERSVRSTRWDPAAPVDAARQLGITIEEEHVEPVPVRLGTRVNFRPVHGSIDGFALSLFAEGPIPPGEFSGWCLRRVGERLAERGEPTTEPAGFRTEQVVGCEGATDSTYHAIVMVEPGYPLAIDGAIAARSAELWMPHFERAARQLRPLRRDDR